MRGFYRSIYIFEKKMIRTSRRSRKAPERLTYRTKEEVIRVNEEENENITDPIESDYEGKCVSLVCLIRI